MITSEEWQEHIDKVINDFDFAIWEPTMELRWWKPNITAILQQKWMNVETDEEEWRDISIIRENK